MTFDQAFDAWLARHKENGSAVAGFLNPPATSAALDAAEKQIGFALPDDLRRLWLRTDGQHDIYAIADPAPGRVLSPLFGEYPLLSVGEALEVYSVWLEIWTEAGDRFHDDYNEGVITSREGDPVYPDYWRPGWLPFAWDNGNGYAVDLSPAPGGSVGQVILIGRDENERRVLGSSITAFLTDAVVHIPRFRRSQGEAPSLLFDMEDRRGSHVARTASPQPARRIPPVDTTLPTARPLSAYRRLARRMRSWPWLIGTAASLGLFAVLAPFDAGSPLLTWIEFAIVLNAFAVAWFLTLGRGAGASTQHAAGARTMTLDENFRLVADWIEAHDGKGAPAFNPPASDYQIAEAERQLGVALPPAIRRLYQLANGQPHYRTGFWGSFQLVSLQDVVNSAQFLNDEFPDGVNVHDEDHAAIRVPPEIRAVWWSRDWIPIMENGGGDHVCVDLDPTVAGTPGQLITFYHDETFRPLVAPGMEVLLRQLAERLRTGECRIEHGVIEGAD